MDLVNDSWHSQIQISGNGAPLNDSGSILDLMRRATAALKNANAPRANQNSGKRIVIILQQEPFGDAKATLEFESKVAEVASSLPTDSVNESHPLDNENPQAYCERLESLGYDPTTIQLLVTDWYAEGVNGPSGAQELERALQWINDHKAQRFRLLNASQEAFDAAMPNEYESLRHYVLREYPEQCERITFRSVR